jgi:predicted signal transduction protein with EAL and GGDEF domain
MLPFLQKPFRIDQFKDRLRMVGSVVASSPGEAALENALRNNQLELWYQPKIDLKSRRICGAEALIRLRHPTRGILLPASSCRQPATRCTCRLPISSFGAR